jgi:DNA-binding CsgD family transcriptional regulator
MFSGIDELRRRIAAAYNPAQVLRGIASVGIMLAGSLLFPADFSLVSDHFAYYAILYGVFVVWHIAISILIRGRLERAVMREQISEILRFETRWFGLTVGALAILTPMPEPFYVNIGWVLSTFLLCWAVANPAMNYRWSNLVVASPLVGWILHSAWTILFLDRGIHVPALVFCLGVSAGLLIARDYFIKQHLRVTLDEEDAAEPDPVEDLNRPQPSEEDGKRAERNLEADYCRFRRLSKRESEILAGILRGRITKEISSDLGISDTTVKTHIKSLFQKAGVRSRLELYADFNSFSRLP